MNPRVRTAIALGLLSFAAAPAIAANYTWLDRPDSADLNSRAALSQDSYVRSFGWAWGDLQFLPDQGTSHPERQARDTIEPRDPVPRRGHEAPAPRLKRDKISMS